MFDFKAFIKMTDADVEVLARLKPLFEKDAVRIIDQFYKHILKFPEVRALLSTDELLNRVKGLQRNYVKSLAGGIYDDHYMQERTRIGRAHESIKLEPHLYLGAYAVLQDLLFSLIEQHYHQEPELAIRSIAALSKLMILDKLLAIESYAEEFNRGERAQAEQRLNQERFVAQESLRHAEKLSAIGTFASGIAHEVGTPLNIISGRAEMAMQRLDADHQARKDLKIILEQIDRISRIISNLLDFAKLKKPQVEPFDLNSVVTKTIEFLTPQIRSKNITVRFIPDENLPALHGDPDQMEQVLVNLIVNANHAMPDGGTLEIQARHKTGNGYDWIILSVRDTGGGIPPEHVAHIFDPFFTTKKGGEGTGLGLPVCLQIIKDHGGEIEVASVPGAGSTFTIHLPLKEK